VDQPPITTSLTYLLAQANRVVTATLERLLAQEGATIEHWRVLEVLSDEQGRSMGELAQLVLMNHPALTKLMDRMVSRGWAHRAADPADSRKVLVFITDAGLAFAARLRQRARSITRRSTRATAGQSSSSGSSARSSESTSRTLQIPPRADRGRTLPLVHASMSMPVARCCKAS